MLRFCRRHRERPLIGYSLVACGGAGGAKTYAEQLLAASPRRMGANPVAYCRSRRSVANWQLASARLVGGSNSCESSESCGRRHNKPRLPSFFGFPWRHLVPARLKLTFGTARRVLALVGQFSNPRVSLLHLNETGCEPAPIAARLAGVPIIVGTLHALPGYDPDKTDLAHRLIEHTSMRCMDVAIAVSQFTKRAWVERVRIHPDRVRVIYNGIDLDKFAPQHSPAEVRLEIGVPPNVPVIGVTARLHPLKGHKYLLRAMPQILRTVPEAHLILAGGGELRTALENMCIRLGMTERVYFLGHREDVPDITTVYDIAVLPSLSECLPYAPIEAMVLQKPVVASDLAGIPEVVDDGVTGTLVSPRDSRALADAIVDLLTHPEKARAFGKAGRRRVEEKFTLDRMLDETFALYDELLARKGLI